MPMSYGFLSTYTPTECGLATFTAALAAELRAGPPAGRIGVVRVVDRLERSARPEIVHHLVTSSPGGEAEAAAILDGFDAVVVQHEYGIYGGPDGDQVLSSSSGSPFRSSSSSTPSSSSRRRISGKCSSGCWPPPMRW